jgi:hypothetical protein
MATTATSQHPAIPRAFAKARLLGSNATSVRGVIAFLKSRKQSICYATPKFGFADLPAYAYDHRGEVRKDYKLQCFREGAAKRAAAWKAAEADRKSFPDEKRSREDKTFRARYLRALSRREKIARTCEVRSLADAITYFDSRDGRKRELSAIRESRKMICPKRGDYPIAPLPMPGMVCPIAITPEACRKVGAPIDMRAKDATLSSHCGASSFEKTAGHTEWKGGRPQKYHRATAKNCVRSFVFIASEREIEYVLHNSEFVLTLPEGYAWRRDDLGLFAIHLESGADYHVDAGDLIGRNAARKIVQELEHNAAIRKAAESEIAAVSDDVYVCFADSLRAGNCRAGTRAFAEKFDLSEGKHYPAKLLKALAPKEPRLKITLLAAAKRHAAEMARGYALLADHQVS